MSSKKIWFDITNTPQVHFLMALSRSIANKGFNNKVFTAREFSETAQLLSEIENIDYKLIGGHHGKKKVSKIYGLASRSSKIFRSKIEFDCSISCGSESAIWLSKLKGKQSIAFGDNDKAKQWTYGRFVDNAFFPDAIEKKLLENQGLRGKLYMYPGYKEDIYIADFKPNKSFLSKLPFDDYVVVRPENIMANYLQKGKIKSITPALLKSLEKSGFNILYLPRYSFDREYAHGLKNVYIPDNAIDGLNACFYSLAVLTGAGTFAREAACLNVPSFSFFAGNDLLAVDKKMIRSGRMHFSRNPDEIVAQVIKSKKGSPDVSISRQVRDDVVAKLIDYLR